MNVRSAGVTDPGRKRRRNEDAYVCEPPLFAVADGMGGAQAGEVASRLAAAALKESSVDADGEHRIVALIQEANRRIYERGQEDPNASGLGTTITVALVEDGIVAFGHVGDSRAYLLRNGSFEQLTEDHSLVAELMRSGKLSAEEAETHPQRSVITRALGTDPNVDVDTFTIEAREGDVFLICSDGLTSMVRNDGIQELIERNRDDLEGAARALVRAANRGGGEDNITVIAFEIVAGEPAERTLEQTLPLPAAAPEPDDEDTLTEADAVPVVDTMVVPPDQVPEALRAGAASPEPAPASEPARWLRLLPVVLVLLLAAGLVVLVLWRLL
jgi:serine/threonine protein phosphatase PrpC